MDQNILKIKERTVTVALVLGYAYLHLRLTGLSTDLSFSKWLSFNAYLPFAQRMLVPAIIAGLQKMMPVPLANIEWFFLFEVCFTSLFFYVLQRLLCLTFSRNQALLLSWLFLLLLPLVTIINYRFTVKGEAAIFFHYDTPTLFFTALSLFLCLTQRWGAFILTIIIASYNRESSLLYILMIPLLHGQTLKRIVRPFLLACFAYLLTKLSIHYLLMDTPGQWVEWLYPNYHSSNFAFNLNWLLSNHYFLLYCFAFAGLPLFWFAFYDFIPAQLRPLKYLLFAYFCGLLLVGKLTEPRILSEMVVLMYYPVCLATRNWILGTPILQPEHPGILYYCDRFSLLTLLTLLVAFYPTWIHLVHYFLNIP